VSPAQQRPDANLLAAGFTRSSPGRHPVDPARAYIRDGMPIDMGADTGVTMGSTER
jgi:hypothetical protein